MGREWMVVCRHWPAEGHTTHFHTKRDRTRAVQSTIDVNHHAEMIRARQGANAYGVREAPWRVVTREVGEWTEPEDGTKAQPGNANSRT